jgi:Ca2+-binding EF-hand superfamily protein
VPISAAAASAKKSGASGDSSSSSASSAPPLDDRIRQYAKSLMKQYDKNGNGQLEKEEWSEMKPEYRAADKNHNDVITLEELTDFLAADSGSGPRQSSSVAVATSAGASNAVGVNAGKSKFRLPTPTERLPKDIPGWFITADTSGDGVVSMLEFIKVKGDTEAAAKEFAQYDLNNDGVVTPQEAVKAAKKK